MTAARRMTTLGTTVAAGILVGTVAAPGHRPLVVAAGVVVFLAGSLLEIWRALAARVPRDGGAWERVRATPPAYERRPSDLEQLERVLGWGRYAPGDFNYQVRPILRRLVAHRLLEQHGVDVDRGPDAARAHVSPELWDLVVAKQAPDGSRVLTTDDVERLVDDIEAIR